MNLIDKAEQRYGHLAIPGILRIVALFQLLVFVLVRFNPEFLKLIVLDPDSVLHGQVWRLLTYLFVPRTFSVLWILIAVMFMWFINDGLEQAWGSFRLNLYYFASVTTLTIGCFVSHFLTMAGLLPFTTLFDYGEFIYHSVFLAFAVVYPNQIINFMLVLPIKCKYIAMISGGYLVVMAVGDPISLFPILFGLLPFFLFAGPKFIEYARHRAYTAENRMRFESNSAPTDEAFHTCYACGKTEHDDPALEFRVAADGEEFCAPCLEARKKEA